MRPRIHQAVVSFFVLFLAVLAGCATDPAAPEQRPATQQARHSLTAVVYHLAQGVDPLEVEALEQDGWTEADLEDAGMVVIEQVIDADDPKTAKTIAHDGGLYFTVSAGSYVNVRHEPPANRCFDVWYRTSGSKVKGNFYWQKSGSSWTHWRTITIGTSPSSTGPVWSNANDSSGAATFRYKFNNNSSSTREMWLEIDDPGTDRDCYDYP